MHTHAINMHGTRFNLACDPQPTLQVLREDRTRQAILRVVRDLDRLVVILHHKEGDSRPEGFGVVQIHVLLDSFDDHRAHGGREVHFGIWVTIGGFGTFGDGVLQKFAVFEHRRFVNEDKSVLVWKDLIDGRREDFAEFVGYLGVDKDSFGCCV